MKLFGKKALSLLLAFMMAFSMCSVAVFAEEEYTLKLSKSSLTLAEGKTAELTATVTPEKDAPDVTWESDDEDVVTVKGQSSGGAWNADDTGNVATVTAKGAGTATITATLKGHDDVVAECTVTVTTDKPYKVELNEEEENTLEVPYGTAKSDVLRKLGKIKFNFYYAPEDDPIVVKTTIESSEWFCKSYDDEEVGTYTFTAKITGQSKKTITVEYTVEVIAAEVTKQEYTKEVMIPTGLTKNEVIDILEDTVDEVKVTVKGQEDAITLNANNSDIFKTWVADDDFKTGYEEDDEFIFTKAVNRKFDALEGLEGLEVKVTVGNEDVGTLAVTAFYDENDDTELDLVDVIENGVNKYLKGLKRRENDSYEVTIPRITTQYGTMDMDRYANKYDYVVDLKKAALNKLKSEGRLTENEISFTAEGEDDGQTYEGVIQITIVNGTFNIEAECTKSTFDFQAEIVNEIIKNLKSAYGKSTVLDYVEFSSIDDDGGTLYESNKKNAYEVDSRTKYYYDAGKNDADLTDLYYVPANNGKNFTADYDAYGTKGESISGTITIGSLANLTMEVTVSNSDVYQFSADEFQAAVTELDKDYTLSYITIDTTNPSYGNLYYEYKANSKKNDTVTSKEEYYAEREYARDSIIDDITFVPNTSKKNVSSTIKFEATVLYGNKNQSSKTISGVLTINIQEEADIVYKTGINTAITFSADDFVNFLKKNVSGSNLTLNSVEFDGLPASTTLGYMYDGNTTTANRISKPDNKTFYYQPSGSKLDLDNLTWLAGTKAGTQHVEFTVYYTKGSNKTTYNKTGYLDLVAENAVTTKQSIKASALYEKFQSDMKSAGASYVEFTSVTGGKLMYNFCQSTQEAVKTGTYYYVSGTGAQKQLAYVSFVPAYGATSGKVTMKGYDTKGTCVIFEYQFTITAVNSSAYFKDVTATSYGAYAKSVDLLYYLKIVQGNSTTSLQFNPTGTLTRGEWIAMLYRAAGSPAVYGTNSFTDVPSWCKDAVQWAVQNGITTGTSTTTFEPNMQLDRMQIALFLYRWAQKLGLDTTGTVNLNTYTDGSTVPAWATTAMQWALKNGYLDTVSGQVKPRDYTTRAVIADCLHRILVK